jgi:hypothetical protein
MQDCSPSSAIEGAVWPVLPDQRGPAILAMLFPLGQSQWWKRDELLGSQLKQLNMLVENYD